MLHPTSCGDDTSGAKLFKPGGLFIGLTNSVDSLKDRYSFGNAIQAFPPFLSLIEKTHFRVQPSVNSI